MLGLIIMSQFIFLKYFVLMQISAWLTNSLDPIEANHQKTDKYWKKVAALYNETTPMDRKRDPKHCKDHWGRSNRKVVQFNGCWSVLNSVYTSGRSDDQLLAEARLKYKAETGSFHPGSLVGSSSQSTKMEYDICNQREIY